MVGEDDDQIKNSTEKTTLFYILIIFISLVLTCCGLYIVRKLVRPRRKKMNELIDDFYHYDSDNKNEGQENNENNEQKGVGLKEMESKI